MRKNRVTRGIVGILAVCMLALSGCGEKEP